MKMCLFKKIMIRDTSILSYKDIKSSGIENTQLEKVYQYILSSSIPPTRREVSFSLGIDTSSVSARVNKLIEMKMVQEGIKRIDTITKKTSYTLEPYKENNGQLLFAM